MTPQAMEELTNNKANNFTPDKAPQTKEFSFSAYTIEDITILYEKKHNSRFSRLLPDTRESTPETVLLQVENPSDLIEVVEANLIKKCFIKAEVSKRDVSIQLEPKE